jgi:S-adenosylmethionine synthetase
MMPRVDLSELPALRARPVAAVERMAVGHPSVICDVYADFARRRESILCDRRAAPAERCRTPIDRTAPPG